MESRVSAATPPQCLHLFITIFIIVITASKSAVSQKVPAIIVFGDSSVDAGNNNQVSTIARSNFQPYGRDFAGGKATGRFSNGRLATDFISEAVGLRPFVPAYLDPAYNISDFAVGVTFASAGTGFDNATADVLVKNQSSFLNLPRIKSQCQFRGHEGVAVRLRVVEGEDRREGDC